MKLQRLAGFGPIAAFISAAGLLGFAVFGLVPIPPSIVSVALPIYFFTIFAWAGGLTVTLVDLEWMDHPATSTRWVKSALVAAIVATVMAPVLYVAQMTQAGLPYSAELSSALILFGIGYGVLVHSLQARKHRLLHGVLAWLGIVVGALFVYLGVLQFIYMFTPKLVMGFVYAFQPSQLLYLVWAIWMGVHLVRSKAPAAARPAAASAAN